METEQKDESVDMESERIAIRNHRISEARKGHTDGMTGRTHSEDTKQAMSEAAFTHGCEAQIEANSKVWVITDPSGEVSIVKNIRPFCKLHNLDASSMSKLALNKRKHHKGYTCEHKELLDD